MKTKHENYRLREKSLIIRELRKHGNFSKASERVGVCRRTVWFWRRHHKEFDERVGLALEEFYDS